MSHANPWHTLSLLDHLDVHRRRLLAFAELVEAPPEHPLWEYNVIPGLLLEEAWRTDVIQQLVEPLERAARERAAREEAA
jgi:hypothetical protein